MITMKDIIIEGNPLLREKCELVKIPMSEEDKKTMEEMTDYIFNSIDEEISKKYDLRPAVGIAAPQIGINKKMLVIYSYDEKGNEHFYPMVNPKLVSYSDELTYLEGGEGCLSVTRETKGYIHRSKRVTVDTYLYYEGKLKKVTLRLKGYLAIIFQHEFDHLNGVLFVDHINKENPFYVPSNSSPVVFKGEEEE